MLPEHRVSDGPFRGAAHRQGKSNPRVPRPLNRQIARCLLSGSAGLIHVSCWQPVEHLCSVLPRECPLDKRIGACGSLLPTRARRGKYQAIKHLRPSHSHHSPPSKRPAAFVPPGPSKDRRFVCYHPAVVTSRPRWLVRISCNRSGDGVASA